MTVLYRKWRPKSLTGVVGQRFVVRTLRNAVRSERIAHAYLFAGPRGTGKTTIARLLAKAANCREPKRGDGCNKCMSCLAFLAGSSLDLVEIDAASSRGIDAMRELRGRVQYRSIAERKIYLIDEAHMLTAAAFGALLKTLEEPPQHVIFVRATSKACA